MKTLKQYVEEGKADSEFINEIPSCVPDEQIQEFTTLIEESERLSQKIKARLDSLLSGLAHEKRETKKMMVTFFKMLRDILKDKKEITDADVKQALNQLKQNAKMAAIIPIFLMPFGTTTTTALYLIGKKYFGVSILPKGLETVFEMNKDRIGDEIIIVENLNEEIENAKI